MAPLRFCRSFISAPLGVAALSLMLISVATTTVAQQRVWTVTCGLPQQDNPLLELMPAGYTGPWMGDPSSGHLQVKSLHRGRPDGGIRSEMWLLSRSVGWWKLKEIWVHPEDSSKLTFGENGDGSLPNVRQIIDSPFLPRPAIVRSTYPQDEELVTGQILALLPDASLLRCASQPNSSDSARLAEAQRALTRRGFNPGPDDGLMGPLTRAALRSFQSVHGLDPHGQLDDTTFERLIAP